VLNLYFAPFLLFFWAVIILIAGCTSDAHAFLYEQLIEFNVEIAPNFRDLLITNDIHINNKFYVIQKIGHISAFGLLFFLLLNWLRRFNIALMLCGTFAFMTEVLQLFFSRNGRLYDVGIDIVGILFSYVMCRAIFLKTKEVSGYENYVK